MTTFRADIQGLRAIAVILVLVYHAGASLLAGGFVGVDVFFVVSGFFLTTHLVQRLDLSGRVGLGEFYARRARRLLPASMLVALLTLVAGFLWMPPIQFEDNVRPAIASILQVPNVLFARMGTNYLAVETPSAFQHYWTLGVEWQFFAVWPLVLWGLWRITRSRRALVLSVGALTTMSFVGSVWLTGYRQPWAFFMLPPRAWEFGVGALVAFALLKGRVPIGERLAAVTGWAGLAAIVGSALVFDASTVFPGVAAAVPALGAAAVLLSGGVPSRWGPTSMLSTRPAQFLGNISFSIYLVHWPLLIITQAWVGNHRPLPLWTMLALCAASIPLGWALSLYVEAPARKVRWLSAARARRTLAATAAAVLVVSGTAIALESASLARPLHSGVTVDTQPLETLPRGTDVVPANLTPALRDAINDRPALYDAGCDRGTSDSRDPSPCTFGTNTDAPRVALFGDSHAAQWYPAFRALADDGLIQLATHTKSSCRAGRLDLVTDDSPSCVAWRDDVIANFADNPPDLVVLGNYPARKVRPLPDPPGAWRTALGSTLESLPEASTVAILADTPTMSGDPAPCLSTSPHDAHACATVTESALDAAIREVEHTVAHDLGAEVIDTTPWLCNESHCPAVVGNTLIHRDHNHITASAALMLEPVIRSEVMRVLDRG